MVAAVTYSASQSTLTGRQDHESHKQRTQHNCDAARQHNCPCPAQAENNEYRIRSNSNCKPAWQSSQCAHKCCQPTIVQCVGRNKCRCQQDILLTPCAITHHSNCMPAASRVAQAGKGWLSLQLRQQLPLPTALSATADTRLSGPDTAHTAHGQHALGALGTMSPAASPASYLQLAGWQACIIQEEPYHKMQAHRCNGAHEHTDCMFMSHTRLYHAMKPRGTSNKDPY